MRQNKQNKIDQYKEAAQWIKEAKHVTAFTGAGISVESGIPPFRGENGLWSRYDPHVLELDYYYHHPEHAWKVIKEIFYDFFGDAEPNEGHLVLSRLEEAGHLHAIITQNIDNLHFKAGSKTIYEFHGNSRHLTCTHCGKRFEAQRLHLSAEVPRCAACGSLLKPDFIFFGEPIPEPANSNSFREANIADLFIVIGTTGEVAPASMIPGIAKQNGARIIEVNTDESIFTRTISDLFLQGKASEEMAGIWKAFLEIA